MASATHPTPLPFSNPSSSNLRDQISHRLHARTHTHKRNVCSTATTMADKEAAVVHNPEIESIRPPNPLSSIISKFTEVVNFRFPPPAAKIDAKKVESESKVAGDTVIPGNELAEELKPSTVRFPDAHPTTVAPLKLQTEELERDTNPVFLWQVYAIGGFFILRWILGRWNERRANKKSSNDDSPAASE